MSQTAKLDIDYVSKLARLNLTDDEKQKFATQLGDVLEYFTVLDSVDVSDIEPTSHAFVLENVWQEDVAKEGLSLEKALMNAPQKRANQVVVPRVVEE